MIAATLNLSYALPAGTLINGQAYRNPAVEWWGDAIYVHRDATDVFWARAGGSGSYADDGFSRRIEPTLARMWTLKATNGAKIWRLPDARYIMPGGPVALVENDGSSTGAISLRTYDNPGSVVATINASEGVLLFLKDNSTQLGEWFVIPVPVVFQ